LCEYTFIAWEGLTAVFVGFPAGWPGFPIPADVRNIFLFCILSGLAVGSTRRSTQWVPGFFPGRTSAGA
jgi:hypothetical protein